MAIFYTRSQWYNRKNIYKFGLLTVFLFLFWFINSTFYIAKGRTDRVVSIPFSHQESFKSRKLLADTADADCRDIHKYEGNKSDYQVCNWIRNHSDCMNSDGFIRYTEFMYCTFESSVRHIATILYFAWLVVLFIGLAVVADEFFCPCLSVMSETLHLTPNVAGVTFLALGNGAPDIFSAVIAAMGGDPGLAFGSLFGAGIFVTTIVAGTVAIVKPFTVASRPLIRDVACYLAAVFLTGAIMMDKRFFLAEAIVYVTAYILYVIMVIISTKVYEKQKNHQDRLDEERRKREEMEYAYTIKYETKRRSSESKTRRTSKISLVSITPLDDNLTDIFKKPTQQPITGASSSPALAQMDENANIITSPKDRVISQLSIKSNKSTTSRNTLSPPSQRVSFRIESEHSESDMDFNGIVNMGASDMTLETNLTDDGVFEPDQDISSSTPNIEAENDYVQGRRRYFKKSPSVASISNLGKSLKDRFRRASSIQDMENKFASVALSRGNARNIELLQLRMRKPRPKKAVKDALRIAEILTVSATMQRGQVLMTDDTSPIVPRMSIPDLKRYDQLRKETMTVTEIEEEERREAEEEELAPFREPWYKLLWRFINPIDVENWAKMSFIVRVYEIVKSPILFVALLFIPRVDHGETLHLWCRPLRALQMAIAPSIGSILFLKIGIDILLGDVMPLSVLLFLIGIPIGIVVWFTSKSDKIPKYHVVFAFYGFIIAMTFIYALVTEIINLIMAVGVLYNIQDGALGLTVLAWGNSVGDYISNLIMARQGFPRMSIAACFGSPLLNVLLGLGIPFTIATIRSGTEITLIVTTVDLVIVIFLVVSLVSALVISPIRNFYLDKKHGLFLIILYFLFLSIALLAEFGAIPQIDF